MAFIYDLADTWNDGATTFNGIRLNVTDTASAAASNLMDLRVGGVSQFRVSKAGTATLAGGVTFGDGSSIANTSIGLIQNRITVASTSTYAFSSTAGAFGTPDIILARDAANTLAQRNGVNAQAFNLYNTYTDASNYERGFMRFVSNVLQIGSDKLGTGTARDLAFQTDGTTRLTVLANGVINFAGSTPAVKGNANGILYLLASSEGSASGATSYLQVGSTPGTLAIGVSGGTRFDVSGVGSVRIVTGLTVATLPSPPSVGMMARVTDATSPTIGSTVTGGGAAAAMCWYNGTNWTVIGV